ncbi:MAG: HD-GYP domain-containing protein [Nitrospiraceae bacterium]|nr:HD-GYP domain-containing protein [Nitrospiraceae bacterium]
MLKRIKATDLQVGMHVVLSAGWLNHPFLKNSFRINSEGQIKKILESGLEDVMIDTQKGIFSAPAGKSTRTGAGMGETGNEIEIPVEWEPEKLVPSDLLEALRDSGMDSREKAGAIYRSSITLMEKLLKDPVAKNIREAKTGIKEIVDIILSETSTARELLKITTHDLYTYTHSVNVGVLAVLLSKSVPKSIPGGLAGQDMHELGAGFFLHDLGKVRVDSNIINKRGPLTPEEMEEVKKHPQKGCEMVSEAGELTEECRAIILQHHERFDGSGYPMGLKGHEIPLSGYICAVADVFDAITSNRSYQKSLTTFQALNYMKEKLEGKFYKQVFDEFVLLFAPR